MCEIFLHNVATEILLHFRIYTPGVQDWVFHPRATQGFDGETKFVAPGFWRDERTAVTIHRVATHGGPL